MLRCDEIFMEICENFTKMREHFLENLGKLQLKFERFSSKILAIS